MKHSYSPQRHQSGAALVVGLLLLLVLTLLAVSGMNSASLELVMAGNTQMQEKVFQMSEQGLATPMADPVTYFVPSATPTTLTPQESLACSGGVLGAGDSTSCEQNTTTITTLDPDRKTGSYTSGGNSLTKTVDYHFRVSSTSTSPQGATTTHVQVVSRLSPAAQ